jgi:hypothetical protein
MRELRERVGEGDAFPGPGRQIARARGSSRARAQARRTRRARHGGGQGGAGGASRVRARCASPSSRLDSMRPVWLARTRYGGVCTRQKVILTIILTSGGQAQERTYTRYARTIRPTQPLHRTVHSESMPYPTRPGARARALVPAHPAHSAELGAGLRPEAAGRPGPPHEGERIDVYTHTYTYIHTYALYTFFTVRTNRHILCSRCRRGVHAAKHPLLRLLPHNRLVVTMQLVRPGREAA